MALITSRNAKNTLNIDFPVDEWFYGAARVRTSLRYWESALMLASAFGLTPPVLTPIQLPFEAGAPWLALEFPTTYTIDSDRLLYTCLYSQAFDPNVRQCGVLLDEWTEVIPATTRDTALTFNYARDLTMNRHRQCCWSPPPLIPARGSGTTWSVR